MAPLHEIGIVTTSTITAVTYLGAFTRFTHGCYTPRFYAYQIDRAPDDASTRAVPYVDTLLATLTLVPAARPFALLMCVVFQGIGIIMRVREGKNPAPDAALCSVAAVACWSSFAAW